MEIGWRIGIDPLFGIIKEMKRINGGRQGVRARCRGQVERRATRADVKVKIGWQGRTARAGGKDGPFLGISPQNGEKCISIFTL